MTRASASLVSVARVVAELRSAWDDQCFGNKNEDVCESCRAYAEAIRCVEWVAKYPEDKS